MKSIFNSKSITLLVAASACSITGYLLYVLLKKDSDDDDYQNVLPRRLNERSVEIRIPKYVVHAIIGRNGNVIKEIQEKSRTRIHFTDKANDTFRTCIIVGSKEACIIAQDLIKDFIENKPILECVDVLVPNALFGKVFGRCGERIFDISSKSGAKISVSDADKARSTRRIILKGIKEQVSIAKSLIDDIIETSEKSQSQINSTLAKREPRGQPKSPSPTLIEENHQVEKLSLLPGQIDSQFDVYISAMIDPSRFWLQIVGPKATELDQLVDEMTDYYKNSNILKMHALDSVNVGDLVAVILRYDLKWYRAEVMEVILEKDKEPHAEVYYVDYGDTDVVPCAEVYELPTNFLRLNFQAIECYLANVEPVGKTWTDEASDKFEELTHVAQWKKLSARMNGFKNCDRKGTKVGGSPIPGVDLYDVNYDKDIDIAQELVNQGYAVFKQNSDLRCITNSGDS